MCEGVEKKDVQSKHVVVSGMEVRIAADADADDGLV